MLLRNWAILDGLLKRFDKRPVRAKRESLEKLGYNFNYLTHQLELDNNRTAMMQFNLRLVGGDDVFELVERKSDGHESH